MFQNDENLKYSDFSKFLIEIQKNDELHESQIQKSAEVLEKEFSLNEKSPSLEQQEETIQQHENALKDKMPRIGQERRRYPKSRK